MELPPGRLVHVSGRGEFFLRDSIGAGPPVLLLHGWMFQSDLNWYRCYAPLEQAGYRVLAVDHRGHGRGLRTPEPFRLVDCAADAAAVVREIGCGPVTVVGYSMGGAIASLMARDHRETVSALVLSATAPDWSEKHMRRLWRSMAGLRLLLNTFPTGAWRAGLRAGGFKDNATTTWVASELCAEARATSPRRGASSAATTGGRGSASSTCRPPSWSRRATVGAAAQAARAGRAARGGALRGQGRPRCRSRARRPIRDVLLEALASVQPAHAELPDAQRWCQRCSRA